MTEILTESFCERCGTRYTFESAAPRKSRFGRVRTVSKGLRNFVLQDDIPLSEAMADARSEEELSATAHQLDAFHKTFNFCLTCRQYTCGNCWNVEESRCLTCAPVAGSELPEIAVDLPVARLEQLLGTETRAAAAGDTDREIVAAEAVGAEAAPRQVRGMAPGQSLQDAVADLEAQLAAEEEAEAEAGLATGLDDLDAVLAGDWTAEPEPEPDAAVAGPEPEPVIAAEPEPVVASEPQPEPVVAAGPEPEPVAAAAPEDVVPQPTWPLEPAAIAEPPAPPAPPAAPPAPQAPVANPWLTVAPDNPDGAEPQWPAGPLWAATTSRREMPTTLAGRHLIPRDNAAALWAASAQEVLAGGLGAAALPAATAAPSTPQPCVSCGLSLSANARFCRRCGTRQP